MLKTYFSLVILQFVGLFFSACFIVLISFAVPADVFGKFSLVLSIIQIVSTVGLGWTNAALLRYAREEYSARGTIGEALVARLSIHVVLMILIFSVLSVYEAKIVEWTRTGTGTLQLIMLGILAISVAEMGSYAGQAVKRFSGYGWAFVAAKGIQFGTAILIYVGVFEGWEPLILGTVLGYGVASTITWKQVAGKICSNMKLSLREVKRILKYSWSVPFGTLGGIFVTWMDMWFINYYLDTQNVGVYSWAYYIILLASTVLMPLSAVLAPRLIDLRVAEDRAAISRYLQQISAIFFVVVSTMPLVMASVFGLFSLVDMGDYQAAMEPTMILLGATVFIGIGYLINPLLAAFEGLVVYGAISSLTVALINAVGNIFLIPEFGISGAAIATAIAVAFGVLTKLILVYRYCEGTRAMLVYPLLFGIVLIGVVIFALNLEAHLVLLLFGLVSLLFFLSAKKLSLFGGMSMVLDRFIEKSPNLSGSTVVGLLYWLSGRKGIY